MVLRVHIQHGSTAWHCRNSVGHQLALNHQYAWRAWPADEFVRRDEHRVFCRERVSGRVHVNRDIGRCGSVVPERDCAVGMQKPRDAMGVSLHARDIRRRRETTYFEAAGSEASKLRLEPVTVERAVFCERNNDDLCARLTPRQFVAVVFIRTDKHHRLVFVVGVGGVPKTHNVDEFVNRRRGTWATKDNLVVVGGVNSAANDVASLLSVGGALRAGERSLGVRIGIIRQHVFANGVFDEGKRAPRRGVVGIDQWLLTKAGRNAFPLAD